MSEMKEKVGRALQDIGIQTGDKTFIMNSADIEALHVELAEPPKSFAEMLSGSLLSGVGVRANNDLVQPGELLVEQKIWTWY